MTPTQTDTLLSAVRDLRDDMGRRFEDVRCDLTEVKAQLTIADSRLTKVETTAAIAADRIIQAKELVDRTNENIESHTLSFRWRIGLIATAGMAMLFGAINVGAHILDWWH